MNDILDQIDQLKDGYNFARCLTDREQEHILRVTFYYLEGVRDLDLLADDAFLEKVYSRLATTSPVVYLSPEQMALTTGDNPVIHYLRDITSGKEPAGPGAVKQAEDYLELIALYREIIRKSLSAVSLGLIRRIDVQRCDDHEELCEDGDLLHCSESLSYRLVYCLTTESCPHKSIIKNALSQAVEGIYSHLKKPDFDDVPSIMKIKRAQILQEPGAPWTIEDISPDIRSILQIRPDTFKVV